MDLGPGGRSCRAGLLGVVALVAAAAVVALLAPGARPGSGPGDRDHGGTRRSTCGAGGYRAADRPHWSGPGRQFRAMWIASATNLDWPSGQGLSREQIRAEYRALLDLAQRNRFNAVIVQVRDSGGVFWPSRREPWSQYLTGVRGGDPGWDPMAFLVTETHRRDLELHAWFSPYRGSAAAPGGAGTQLARLAPGHPLRRHPEWAVAYPIAAGEGRGRLYYDPGVPAARRFISDLIVEAVERYDVDGVHFDDYFYPYPVDGEDFPDAGSFAAFGVGWRDRGDWRRDNVDRLIREVGTRVRASKPWVRFGVSPLGIWRNGSADPRGSRTRGAESYSMVFADTRRWIREGWIDYVAPQLYWPIGFPPADYRMLVEWWARQVRGTRVQLYIGQAAYRPGSAGWSSPLELSAHLTLNQRYPRILGDVYFSAKDVRADRLGAMSQVVRRHYRTPALVPAWGDGTGPPVEPVRVTGVRRDSKTSAVTLTWAAPRLRRTGPAMIRSYAVYRAERPRRAGGAASPPVLLASTRQRAFVDRTARPDRRYTYLVSALDRMARESAPSQPCVAD